MFEKFYGKRFGSLNHRSPETIQAHRTIEFFEADRQAISATFAQMYSDGLSLSDISKQTGKAKNTIRDGLLRAGVELRSCAPEPVHKSWRAKGKRSIRPFYGFCYFQGEIVPDQKEFQNLLLIHEMWTSGQNPNSIADTLNAKKIQPRIAKSWNRNSVVLILDRFEQRLITVKGAKYELR